MAVTKTLRAIALVHTSILLLLLFIAGCYFDSIVGTEADVPTGDYARRMSVLSATADSVTIEARWSTATDESGIARYDWLNWRSTPDTVVAGDSTSLFADTFSVARPGINETLNFGFQIRAVDGAGNVGSFSPAHMWSLANEDTIPPPPPDSVVVDTLVVGMSVWPKSIEIDTGTQVQFYAALLIVETAGEAADTSIVCDTPPPAPGALYDSGTFCCGCDSAAASLPWTNQGASPVPIVLNWQAG